MTIAAVSPYVLVALVTWARHFGNHISGASAPIWYRFLKVRARS